MVLWLFIISLSAGILIVVLTLVSVASEQFSFWPPPCRASWQYRSFWILFRLMFFGIVLLVCVDFRGLGPVDPIVTVFGTLVFCLGFGVALHATGALGWQNAHGERQGLRVTGWFAWSRNPIYVATLFGMFGLGSVVNSVYVNTMLGIWAVMYLAAPFLEEPWLEAQYGQDYCDYKSTVRRFIGRRRH